MRHFVFAILPLLALVPAVRAAEPAVSAKLIANKAVYDWPVGQTPAEFAASLKEAQARIGDGKPAVVPKPLLVDFTLEFRNETTETIEIGVLGDVNTLALELDGPGVITLAPPKATTLELRLPKMVKIAPGKTHAMLIGQLSDGFRANSRDLYFTAPGEYTLKATYQLADAAGNKGTILKTEGVKFTVSPPK